jgi:nicotinamide phosphoribosyltransferase
MILRDVWTAATIAARIFYMAQRINEVWAETSDNPMSPFAILDFSSRGTMGYDHSVIGGHRPPLHFQGSDNVPAIRAANYYYFSDMAAWSVIATEHSISCSFGYGTTTTTTSDNSIENGPRAAFFAGRRHLGHLPIRQKLVA